MCQVSGLRLLFPCSLSSNPLFKLSLSSSLFSKSKNSLKPLSPFTVLAYSGRRGRRGGSGGFLHQRRGNSSLREERGRDTAPAMEEKEGAQFNKRRAEGRDKSRRPKELDRKIRKLNPVNTICYVQILGTGMDTQDTSPSVLLFFDRQRFIFNAGEGLQRFCTEYKIKLSKIDHMFLTRVCSETAGGLPGLLLTLAGMGEEGMSVNIWGPSDLNYLVDAMRSFIPHAAMVHTHSFGEMQNNGASVPSPDLRFTDPIILIDDEVVRISAIPLRPIQSTGSRIKPGDIAVIYACELPEIKGKFDPDKAKFFGLKEGPKFGQLKEGKSVMSDRDNIMVHPSDVLGPSLPGPIVLLVDCPTPSHLLELLSLESLNSYFVDSNHPREGDKSVNCIIHMGPASVTKTADYEKWMRRFGSAKHIMAGHEMKNMEIPILKSSARISSRLHYLCPQLFPAPGFWSLQHINNSSLEPNRSCEDPSPTLCETISADNLLKFNLRPYTQLGFDRSVIPSLLNHTGVMDELLSEIPEIVDVSKHVRQFWQSHPGGRSVMPPKDDNVVMVEEPWILGPSCLRSGNMHKEGADVSHEDIPCFNGSRKEGVNHNSDVPPCLENITREEMEIVLLGTGSSQPSKYRNVSSIFVNLFSKGSLLLDCGEGTLAQLKRRFGTEGADSAVKALQFIWISHIHADHHTGLARILARRSQLLKDAPHEPILVIGPRQLNRFLDAYSRLEDLDMQFLDCRHTTEASLDALLGSYGSGEDCSPVTSQPLETNLFTQGSIMQSYWKRHGSPVDTAVTLPLLMRLKQVLSKAGLEALHSVPVIHCPQAFGVVLKATDRKTSAGKTIPGWKLVYSGDTRPCQALIDASRDATVLIHEATFEDSMEEEAIARNHSTTKEAVGVGASAGAYRIILTHFSQRYPKIPVFDETHMDRTCIAFDLMSVNAADLPVLPKVLPYLKVLFRNEMVGDESDDVLDSAVCQ